MWLRKPNKVLTKPLLGEIYNAYWKALYNVASCYVTDATIVEEIVQEVFVKLWLNRSGFKIEEVEAKLLESLKSGIYNHFENSRSNVTCAEYSLMEKKLLNEFYERSSVLNRMNG